MLRGGNKGIIYRVLRKAAVGLEVRQYWALLRAHGIMLP